MNSETKDSLMGRYSGKTCRLSVMLTLTFTFFLVEIVFGYITNSMALVADSFHMLSDVVALIIAFFCMKVSFPVIYCFLRFSDRIWAKLERSLGGDEVENAPFDSLLKFFGALKFTFLVPIFHLPGLFGIPSFML